LRSIPCAASHEENSSESLGVKSNIFFIFVAIAVIFTANINQNTNKHNFPINFKKQKRLTFSHKKMEKMICI
jgi:hypothetical protein